MKQYQVNAYKLSLMKDSEEFYNSAKLNSSKDSYQLLCKFLKPEITRMQEVFSVIGVNTANVPIGWSQSYQSLIQNLFLNLKRDIRCLTRMVR